MLSNKTEELFRELRSAICESASASVSDVRSSNEPIGERQKDAFLVLRKHLKDDNAIGAFERVLFLSCYGAVASVLSVLDGSAASTDLDVALRDRDSGEDLAPVDDSYLDAFVGYLMDHERDGDWPIRL